MHLFHLIPLLADAASQAADTVRQHKSNALAYAIKKATPEGKMTMSALLVLSLFSWTIIITKARQLSIARKWAKKFFAAYEPRRAIRWKSSARRRISRARRPTIFTFAAPMNWITI